MLSTNFNIKHCSECTALYRLFSTTTICYYSSA